MEKIRKITVEQCCIHYSIETSFVKELNNHGLIQLSGSGKKRFIHFEQLANLEKYIHLHYDLEINIAGLEAISHLLRRMNDLQKEVSRLHNDKQ